MLLLIYNIKVAKGILFIFNLLKISSFLYLLNKAFYIKKNKKTYDIIKLVML